jgi:hypothetical protein
MDTITAGQCLTRTVVHSWSCPTVEIDSPESYHSSRAKLARHLATRTSHGHGICAPKEKKLAFQVREELVSDTTLIG